MSELFTEIDLHAGLSEATRAELIEDMRRGHRAQMTVAMQRQAALKRIMDGRDETWGEGLGRRIMHVPSEVYFEMVRRYGDGIWRDPKFRKRMMEDEPSLRVNTRPRRTSVRVTHKVESRNEKVENSAGARTRRVLR